MRTSLIRWLKKPVEEKTRGITYRLDKLGDFLFETRYGLDFSGYIPPDELVTDHSESRAHAHAYLAADTSWIRILINEAAKTCDFDNFIDIGSGKGKACLYAARTGLFKKVLGVEFSKPLVEIARANAAKYKCSSISFAHEDASTFVLPAGRNLVFLFNPMDGFVIRKIINNNIASFRDRGSLIAYAVDEYRSVILGCARRGRRGWIGNGYARGREPFPNQESAPASVLR